MTMTFTNWYKDVCNKLTKSGDIKLIEKEFITQITDKGRVSTLITKNTFMKEEITESYNGKNNKQSESYRNIGNKLYGSSSLDNAIKAYTKSIKLAEKNSKALSLSYANRSAVFFAVKDYGFCENDILLAFKNGYPEELHYKLYERVGKCYYEMEMHQKANESFNICLKSIENSNLDQDKCNEKTKAIAALIEKCETGLSDEPDKNIEVCNHIYEPVLPEIPFNEHNDIYTSASKSFFMKSDSAHGRYAVACEDIKAGEVIVIEKSFASVCLPECFETHCYQCLKRFKFAYPCRNCSAISYCSTGCENKSWGSFHQYECNYLNLLSQDDVGLGHLAMKVVLKNSLGDLKEFDQHCAKGNEYGINKSGLFETGDYSCLYSLVGNSDLRTHSDLFKRSAMALYLTKILQKTNYLCETDHEMGIIVAGHLLKQIQMLPCNAHEVSEAQLVGKDLASNELKEIGSAAYTTLSLLNHSCDPSVVRHCYRDTCVVRALKHIKKGEEIVDNYGFLYAVQEKIERVQHLKDQYYFTCQCIPCLENWPLYSSLNNEIPIFNCCKCPGLVDCQTLKCSQCLTDDQDVADFYRDNMQESFESTMERVLNDKSDNTEQDLASLLSYLDLLTRKAKLPTIHVNNCQEIVKLCFSLKANFARL